MILLLIAGCAERQDPRYGPAGKRVSLVQNYFVSPEIESLKGQTVAVLPFDNWTEYMGSDLLVTDEFNLQLGRTGMFRLVERMRVDELFVEQDLDPARLDQKHAVKAGRLLGAKAVILGTIYQFKPGDEPPKVGPRIYPFVVPTRREDMEVAALANGGIFILWALANRAEEHDNAIGLTVRLVEVETGKQLWQARDLFSYRDPRVEALLENSYERRQAKREISFMNQLLCQELALTLTSPPKEPLRVGDPEGTTLPRPEEILERQEERQELKQEWAGQGGGAVTFNLVQGLNKGGTQLPWGSLPNDWLHREF